MDGEVEEARRLPGRLECERERLGDDDDEAAGERERSEVGGAKERLKTESR